MHLSSDHTLRYPASVYRSYTPSRRVAVTGGAGFIGANLCRLLARVDQIDEVVVVDDLSTGDASNLSGLESVRLVEDTILNRACLDHAFAGASAVVHLAARPSVPRSIADPVATHAVNATGTLEVLEAARRAGVPAVVVASSSSVYGASRDLPKHEGLVPAPMSPYAASKLAAESYALAYATCFGLDILALRFFNVFGPLQAAGHAYAAVVPTFVSAALEGRPLPVHGDGRQSRDFTFVDSVASVLVDAVLRRVSSATPVNLAFGTSTTLLGLATQLEAILGRPLEREHLAPRAGDVPASQADSSRLHALFPDAVPVPLPDALRATIEWSQSQRLVPGSASVA